MENPWSLFLEVPLLELTGKVGLREATATTMSPARVGPQALLLVLPHVGVKTEFSSRGYCED